MSKPNNENDGPNRSIPVDALRAIDGVNWSEYGVASSELREIRHLLKSLFSESRESRSEAWYGLFDRFDADGDCGVVPAVTEALVVLLSHRNLPDRGRFLDFLHGWGSNLDMEWTPEMAADQIAWEEAVDAAVDILGSGLHQYWDYLLDRDQDVQIGAMWMLSLLCEDGSIVAEILATRMHSDEDFVVRAHAAMALGKLGNPEAIPQLRAVVESRDAEEPSVQLAAACAWILCDEELPKLAHDALATLPVSAFAQLINWERGQGILATTIWALEAYPAERNRLLQRLGKSPIAEVSDWATCFECDDLFGI